MNTTGYEMETKSRSKVQSFNIYDTMLQGRVTGVQFGSDSIMIFPQQSKVTQKGKSNLNTPVQLYQVCPDTWLSTRHARQLISEAVGTFTSLQVSLKVVEAKERRVLLVKKCREYRSMIQGVLEEVKSLLDEDEVRSSGISSSPSSEEEREELNTSGHLLYKMELILSFVETIFIDTRPGGVVMTQLLAWIRMHFPQCQQQMAEMLSLDNPYEHAAYWETIYGLVLQGYTDEARNLLTFHPSAQSDPFLFIGELLRKMPVYQVYSGISEAEFNLKWQRWRCECESRLQQGFFVYCLQINTICQILCGDKRTLLNLMDIMDTWYHYLVSSLLFTSPTCKVFRIFEHAQTAIKAVLGGEEEGGLTTLDQVLLAAMEMDRHKVVKECQVVLDNSWFTAHLTDLLHHSLQDSEDENCLIELREFLLLELCTCVASRNNMWDVAVAYLDHCGLTGSMTAQAILERVPLTDDRVAQKVLLMVRERNFDDLELTVCRVMGRRALCQGRLGAAIRWGIQARDPLFASHVAHQILRRYVCDGMFEATALLDCLGPSIHLSDTLTFIGKYREFHNLYQEERFNEAATLLVSLVSSGIAPEYFWPVLLLESLPLLQVPGDPVVSSEQTYALMHCMHELTHNKSEKVMKEAESAMKAFQEKEKEILLSLTENLARAFLHEGSQP